MTHDQEPDLRDQEYLLGYVRRFPVDIFFGPGPQPLSGDRTRHASGVLVRTGKTIHLLTASHIITRLKEYEASGARTFFQVGGVQLHLSEQLAWQNSASDLAMIRVEESDAKKIGTTVHEPGACWPPPIPQAGTFVLVAGFPKELRRETSANEIEFGDFVGLLRVRETYDDHFACQIEREFTVPIGGRGLPPVGADLGGMSGAPVLAVGDLSYPLVGVVKEDYPPAELILVQGLLTVPIDPRSSRVSDTAV